MHGQRHLGHLRCSEKRGQPAQEGRQGIVVDLREPRGESFIADAPQPRDKFPARLRQDHRTTPPVRGIGLARLRRYLCKRLLQFFLVHLRIDALRIRTAGPPDLDDRTGALHPMAGGLGSGVRATPRCFRSAWTEQECQRALLRMN